MDRQFQRKLGLVSSLALFTLIFGSPVSAEVKVSWSAELIGKWMKTDSGETIEFKEKGDVDLFLSGAATSFSGNGSFDRCTDGGGNLCIAGPRLKCAYRYTLVQGKLNLQFRSGAPDVACRAAAGDFRSLK